MTSGRKPLILIGEDDPADRDLIHRALSDGLADFVLAADGAKVIEYIDRTLAFDTPTKIPDLIIIDLNMPRLNGKQVLDRIRENESISAIPVIVFSSSNRQSDIDECYAAGCASYIVKPTDLEPFMGALDNVIRYWLQLVERRSPVR